MASRLKTPSRTLTLAKDLWLFPVSSHGNDQTHVILKAGTKVKVGWNQGLGFAHVYQQHWTGKMLGATIRGDEGPGLFKNWPKEWTDYRQEGNKKHNPVQRPVTYYTGFSDDAQLREALIRDGVVIEKEITKEFTPGAGGPMTQFTVRFDDGYYGYLVPRRGMPGGKMYGKVWYEWHQLDSPYSKARRGENPRTITTITEPIARAAAQDAGNRSMRKAGRTQWNEEDFNAAAQEYERLWPSSTGNNPAPEFDQWGRPTVLKTSYPSPEIGALVQAMNLNNSLQRHTPYMGVEITESRTKYHLLNHVLTNGQRSGLFLIDKTTGDVYKSPAYGKAGRKIGTVASLTEEYRKANQSIMGIKHGLTVNPSPAHDLGIRFVLGIRGRGSNRKSEVQSVLFNRALYTIQQAKEWLVEHSFKTPKPDMGGQGEYMRFRQKQPGLYRQFSTITPGEGYGAHENPTNPSPPNAPNMFERWLKSKGFEPWGDWREGIAKYSRKNTYPSTYFEVEVPTPAKDEYLDIVVIRFSDHTAHPDGGYDTSTGFRHGPADYDSSKGNGSLTGAKTFVQERWSQYGLWKNGPIVPKEKNPSPTEPSLSLGDRVRSIHGLNRGKEGTITAITPSHGQYLYTVAWEGKPWGGGEPIIEGSVAGASVQKLYGRRNPTGYDLIDVQRESRKRAQELERQTGAKSASVAPAMIEREFNIWWEYEGRDWGLPKTEALKAWKYTWRTHRKNPSPESASLYESFHGAPSEEIISITTPIHEHSHLATLGHLVELQIKTPTGLLYTKTWDGNPSTTPYLASSEDGLQLFIEGGDQSVDLHKIAMDGKRWLRDSMLLGVITKITYRTEKSFDNFDTIDYFHRLGEETRVRPSLIYDSRSRLMSISGGQYHIDIPSTGVSRGLIN